MPHTPPAALAERFRGHIAGTFRWDRGTRELYARDASIYRRLPLGCLVAAHADDVRVAVDVCGELGVPITPRGAGTSLAGQALGRGLVLDTSRLRACRVDPERRDARVEPGVVLDDLNAAAARHGLTFGPDVATANRATLGGMIANNSAGARSVVHGLTADAVLGVHAVFADGGDGWVRLGEAPPTLQACRALGEDWSGPDLLRRVSGYNLDALRGPDPDWPRLLCGSEGTLALTVEAEVRLQPLPQARALALLSFPHVDDALDAVPHLLADGPSAIELLDAAMLDPANRPPALAHLTAFGGGARAMLVVEHSGDPGAVRRAVTGIPGATPVLDAACQAAVWTVRRTGIARALRGDTPGVDAHPDELPLPFIEDPAVPPHRMRGFAAEVRRVLADEGLHATWYGHASVGCLHIRPFIDVRAPGALARMRRVAEAVADLVVAHDGSLSGEHGDGRLRSELLPRMYPPRTIAAFASLKRTLDPTGLLNPGVIVDPEPLDAGLRQRASPPRSGRATSLSFARDGGLARAAEACNGNAACRASASAMCPSFRALRDERHATRGRAVLFRAAIEGRLPDGLADDALHEALELCLGCKACAAECPASVDMAALRVEALAYRNALRGTPLAARIAGHAPSILALAGRMPAPVRRAGAAAGTLAVGRRVPTPARTWRATGVPLATADAVLVADTFTAHLHPRHGDAAVRVLEATGARVHVARPGCCGRTLLGQGMVAAARGRLRAMLAGLAPAVDRGVPVVLLEPSCWSMLRDDGPRLLPDDPLARSVAEHVELFEHAVLRLGVPPLREAPARAVVQPHCHARALGATERLTSLLRTAPGVTVADTGAGCCGMAGAFGYRHPEVSRRIAADRMLPAVRDAQVVVAHGTSCLHQLEELAGRPAVHPAVFLAERLA